MSHKRLKEITPIEKAIIELAAYLEDTNHDQYPVKKHIMEILGVTYHPN